jgi:hypothetical protein
VAVNSVLGLRLVVYRRLNHQVRIYAEAGGSEPKERSGERKLKHEVAQVKEPDMPCYINRLKNYNRNAFDYCREELAYVAVMHKLGFSNWRLRDIVREAQRVEARAKAERN